MKHISLMFALVVLVGCGNKDTLPFGEAAIEAATRKVVNKPEGKLVQADRDRVTVIDVREKKITDVGTLASFTHLEELDLGANQLTDVSGLKELTLLKKLNLGGNQLSSLDGLEGLVNLEELHLNSNQLTDVTVLEGLKKLAVVNLHYNTNLTRSNIDKLQKALPKCKIMHSVEK
jgi:Leucine-rich repeat (LRR) protein